jgi:DNA-binding NtrC family response regulator
MSDAVLVIDEIPSRREELVRALDAEGFKVTESDSAASAVRDIWENQFLVVFIGTPMSGTDAKQLSKQLQQMAPEIETILHSKTDVKSKLVRKAVAIRDGS